MSTLKPFKRASISSIETNMVMVALSSLSQALLLENSKTKSNVAKSESTCLFQSPCPCFHSLEIRNPSMEIWTSMVRMVCNSSPNGKLSPPVGKKRKNLQLYQHPSPPTNDCDWSNYTNLLKSINFLSVVLS